MPERGERENIARVLVDSPLPQLDRLLDYRIPTALEGVAPGVRVSVPLRTAGRITTGFVIEISERLDYPGPLSDLAGLVSPVPVLRPEVWRLARAVADRAAGSAADILRLTIPPRQVRVEKAWLARDLDRRLPEVTAPATIDGYGDEFATALAEHRRVALSASPGVERTAGGWVARWAVTLATAAAASVGRGESAILVAPDHRDETQLDRALSTLLPEERIVRMDARQPNAARYAGLLRAAGDDAVVVLGNRSAVYAPAERLGLLAIWNDGDPLLGEQLAPYVHAREAALVRHQQQGGALVLAGHTRSTEVERLVEIGWLEHLQPTRLRRPRVIPTADVVADDPHAATARIPTLAWRTAHAALEHGPVLVQVARPGFSPALRCAECGQDARCARCGGPLRRRRSGEPATCTWCGTPAHRFRCPNCSGTGLRAVGTGSQRTADELGRAFPNTRVVVSDGERPVLEVGERPALVVATRGAEPFAPGGYRAVLLLDGDRMLARESLRVGEDCLRWWTDAASLAADAAPVVLVGVGGSIARALAAWDPSLYSREELAARRELRFPPAVRVATLEGTPEAVAEALRALPPSAEALGMTQSQGRARAILRFDYAAGAEVAAAVRSEIVRAATKRRKPVPGAPPRRGRQQLPLRARFDDPDPFEE